VGTLSVYLVLLAYRREQLGFQFDRRLLREMNRFGMPLLPAALALWAIGFVDRWFVAVIKDQDEVGVYSVAVRMSSGVLFLMLAVRRAWPTVAYSIEDDEEARRTYSFVVTYVVFLASWAALGLSLLAPWLVDVFTSDESFARAAEAVPFLAFGGVAYAAYSVVAVASARSKRTQGNWIVAGGAAALNIGLNLLLIPPYGMVGAAVATLVSYAALFAGMVAYGQKVFRVQYQWRRLSSAAGLAAALAVAGIALDLPLAAALPLALAFPVLLAPLGFYLPGEVRRLLRFVPAPR
jgi:O-antigen/teichoic acid export membrane protein